MTHIVHFRSSYSKLGMMAALWLVAGSSLYAQNLNRQTRKIDADQVPVAVRQAFENDFGATPAGGYWIVQFTTEVLGERTTAVPSWYAFNKRGKGEKVEVRFSPQGELLFAKGLDRSKPARSPAL